MDAMSIWCDTASIACDGQTVRCFPSIFNTAFLSSLAILCAKYKLIYICTCFSNRSIAYIILVRFWEKVLSGIKCLSRPRLFSGNNSFISLQTPLYSSRIQNFHWLCLKYRNFCAFCTLLIINGLYKIH